MDSQKEIASELKGILEFSSTPFELDGHPWTECLSVRQFVLENPELLDQSPGYQLLATLNGLFAEMMPSTPPRRGKRLDTIWGQFGVLAALYFTPFKFGQVRPANLRDAWGRIDLAIALFVFGKPIDELPEDELNYYRLVGDEIEVTPTSTISDWHIKGIEKLAQSFMAREQRFAAQLGESSTLTAPEPDSRLDERADAEIVPQAAPPSKIFNLSVWYRRYRGWVWISLGLALAFLMGWKAIRIFGLLRAFQQDVSQLQAVVSVENVSLDALTEVGPLLATARSDVLALQSQVAPFGWAGRFFEWLPVYGGDLAYAADLVDLAAGLLVAGDEGFQAAAPLLVVAQSGGERPSIAEILEMLVAAQPGLAVAREALDDALLARANIDIEQLSTKTRPLLEKIDPYLPMLDEGMDVLDAIPKMLGAAEGGPQTYLVLIQNEDEIRATGGFITAIAVVTVDQGEIIALRVEDSYTADDPSKIYPYAPWQMQEYMYLGYMLLRDSNWSPDFTVSASWAEHLYAYYSAHSVDGVIAIDQQVIHTLIAVLGPIQIDGEPEPVTTSNVIDYMRSAKDQFGESDPERKEFMSLLARALLGKIQSGSDIPWQRLVGAIIQSLDERHIQVQMDDPAVRALLAARGWDGAVRPGPGDFLMVVDSNLGFNKVNAAATTELIYQVDLSNPVTPKGMLTLIHRNPATGDGPCVPGPNKKDLDYVDIINRCYWNYVRVYTHSDAELLDANPHYTPRKWMIKGQAVPRRVDVLDNNGIFIENPGGTQAYGTLLVVPRAGELQTQFEFALPPDVLGTDAEELMTYQLHVRKQAGTIGVPLKLQIILPQGAQIIRADPKGVYQDGIWQADLALRTDLYLSLVWQIP